MTQPVTFDHKHEEAAGRAMKVLRELGTPPDAQVAIACMCMYLCEQHQIDGVAFLGHLKMNMLSLAKNELVYNSVMKAMNRLMDENKIFVSPLARESLN